MTNKTKLDVAIVSLESAISNIEGDSDIERLRYHLVDALRSVDEAIMALRLELAGE